MCSTGRFSIIARITVRVESEPILLDTSAIRPHGIMDLFHIRGRKSRGGVSLSAAALATALASEAVSAAPVGLALGVVGTALASAAAGGTALTVLKIMNMTTFKLSAIGAIVVGGLVVPLAIQHQSVVKEREENQASRQQVEQMATLETENDRLSILMEKATVPSLSRTFHSVRWTPPPLGVSLSW